ncbi:class I SAM-dependent rRNA methyltransferase [Reyranella sp. CPCC 100927]|uniref:class I SAM-dependent rRNA methyltransferase n=1 Tax=Reyranella sp. CPCC 100927 TaxID=2599616 RepID=UPI0011B84009|nr:class I SAM-dependent rRNA methyltransferase [Reyranella sp. CPCC 100927]TWT15701.1 class I SAM-dependent rRNA methyltransferase [Reyranella sp. CPCC 100927]
MSKYPSVLMRAGEDRRLRLGHPWAFSNEILMEPATKALAPGSPVVLRAAGGDALGIATFNPHSLIAARVVCADGDARLDRSLIESRLAAALQLRTRLYGGVPHYRLVHAEADGLPGLIVDRYGDVCVVQTNTAGMDRLTNDILAALDAVVAPAAVLLKNDSPARKLEGLELETRILKGEIAGTVDLIENGARFVCDPAGGQKTGWFFDQRDNRAMVAAFAAGARVLDTYTYAGGFGVLAAVNGAAEVHMVDRSQPALDLAKQAAEANSVGARCRFTRAEVFDELARLDKQNERFDVVICDPPAFVKSRKDIKPGAQGYRKMTRLAAPLVVPSGLLFVASCSHLVDPTLFAEQVKRGLHDAGREARVLRATGAGMDHPVHPSLPETAYLKGLLLALD